MTPDLLDDLFLGIALAAFVEEARERQGWPDSRAVKRRAYDCYEAELAERNQGPAIIPSPSVRNID